MGHLGKFTLDNICKHLNIILETHHRAVDDATATGKIFVEFISMLKEKDITDLDQVNEFANDNVDLIKKDACIMELFWLRIIQGVLI